MAAAVDRLGPADREVLRLVAWEGLTPAELAVALGVRPGTARVRLHRARRALAADPAVRALVEEPLPIS
jgi:RNA polymerase sigma-70 factor, ECF subfamily